MIKGRHVNLRRPKLDDIPRMVKWRQDAELSRYYDELPLNMPLEVEQELRAHLQSPNRLDFTIETKKGEAIGVTYLASIDWRNRNAELHIKVGEKERRSFIFGADASFLMLLFSFQKLNMHKVYARILEFSRESERLAKHIGFKKEAVLRKAAYQKGRYWDLRIYGLLKREFRAFLGEERSRRYLNHFRSGSHEDAAACNR